MGGKERAGRAGTIAKTKNDDRAAKMAKKSRQTTLSIARSLLILPLFVFFIKRLCGADNKLSHITN
jgi:hypothetical protein